MSVKPKTTPIFYAGWAAVNDDNVVGKKKGTNDKCNMLQLEYMITEQ